MRHMRAANAYQWVPSMLLTSLLTLLAVRRHFA